MSLNQIKDPILGARQDIFCKSCTCSEAKIAEKLIVKDLFFDAQNGDPIELSSLPTHGLGGERLTSNGDGTVSWVPGAGSSGVDYSGVLPVSINKVAIYGATDGLLIKDSSLDEADLLDTQAQANTNESNITNLQNDKLNIDGTSIMTGNLSLGGNSITNTNDVQTESIGNTSGAFDINLADAVLNINRTAGGNILLVLNEVGNRPFFIRKSGVVNDICSEGTDELHLTTDCFLGVKKVILSPNNDTMLLRDYSLDMNNNDITNIRSMTATATQYISRVEDMGSPVGDYYVIPDNTTWIILGQITLEYGIEYGANCSLRGIDFSAQITFDETSRDCSIKSVDNNFYLSQITIVGGGGRFSLSGRGLLDAQNYNVGAPAPFYGRNKRFKVTDCNILRPWKIGTIEGFGTLNITNNFFNGGGGLAGQPTSYYTNEGIAISDGLSLEFNNNKVVLMLGAQQVSTAKLLNMKARVSPLLGFNACTITGNIFHPRNSETGIDFDDDSRTQLGNISGNVFIRTGGSAPLINYTDQTLYDNYNPLSIENYSVNANTGVVDSEPNLKSAVGNSVSTTAVNPARTEAVPSFNDQVLQINTSARFSVQVNMTGGSQAFVANERMSDAQLGTNFLILAVEPAVGVSPNITQTVYVTDMSATPQQIPNPPGGWTSPSGGSFTTATFTFRYRYSEKDPRKLVTVATFTISTGNNEQYFVAPGNGVADVDCEVSGVANASGVGGTVSLSCTRRFNEGDIINFFLSSAGGSSTSIDKAIINIK